MVRRRRPVYFDAINDELPEYASLSALYGRFARPLLRYARQTQTEPVGFIPQVEHTYAYFDGNYGIMNEHQLMFGECTNGSKTDGSLPGLIVFYSAELARVARNVQNRGRGGQVDRTD